MRKLLLILTLGTLLFNCSNTSPKLITNSDELLTVQQQKEINQDTIYWKVYRTETKDILLINPTTNKVEYQIDNYSGALDTVLVFCLILFIYLLIVVASSITK